jgi:hypothetical protein
VSLTFRGDWLGIRDPRCRRDGLGAVSYATKGLTMEAGIAESILMYFIPPLGISDKPPDLQLRLKQTSLLWPSVVTVLLAAVLLEAFPYTEELTRGLRERRRVLKKP